MATQCVALKVARSAVLLSLCGHHVLSPVALIWETSLVICLPSIVALHKLTGNGQHTGKPDEQYHCQGPLCRSVRLCGKTNEIDFLFMQE